MSYANNWSPGGGLGGTVAFGAAGGNSGGNSGSGPTLGITALNFNSGFTLPYSIFVPVEWAPLNSQGVAGPTGSSGTGSDSGTGITPELLAASQANLSQIAQNGLQTISFTGQDNQAIVGGFLSSWSQTLASIAQQNAQALTTSINKSAKACSGFFSCLFG